MLVKEYIVERPTDVLLTTYALYGAAFCHLPRQRCLIYCHQMHGCAGWFIPADLNLMQKKNVVRGGGKGSRKRGAGGEYCMYY